MPADPRYPIGPYQRPATIDATARAAAIDAIAEHPRHLTQAVAGLTDDQLDTPYRDGGWTVRQVVHHLPDSHVNAYIRMKLAATEDHPSLQTYNEAAWAELTDAKSPVSVSLPLLFALHERWTTWLRSVDSVVLERTAQHPEWNRVSIDELLQIYAWHGRHHVAHITTLKERMNW